MFFYQFRSKCSTKIQHYNCFSLVCKELKRELFVKNGLKLNVDLFFPRSGLLVGQGKKYPHYGLGFSIPES